MFLNCEGAEADVVPTTSLKCVTETNRVTDECVTHAPTTETNRVTDECVTHAPTTETNR